MTGRALVVVENAAPNWTDDGQPCCSESCPSYDGKRCTFPGMGVRPALHCEPTIIAMAALLRKTRTIAIDCVYSARDPKWSGGDAEIDAIIAKHTG